MTVCKGQAHWLWPMLIAWVNPQWFNQVRTSTIIEALSRTKYYIRIHVDNLRPATELTVTFPKLRILTHQSHSTR
jgi:hypothetical protein